MIEEPFVVPLVVYIDGERRVIGTAVVTEDEEGLHCEATFTNKATMQGMGHILHYNPGSISLGPREIDYKTSDFKRWNTDHTFPEPKFPEEKT